MRERNPWNLRWAVRALRAGAVVAYPTEAVYGLGCDPFNQHAVLRLLAVKGRAVDKGLILIAADLDQLKPLLLPQSADTMAPVLESWPGPSTWILPADPRVPVWLTGGSGCIAVRVTAHPLAARLCQRFGGPLISTSANRSGRPPARTALQARRALGSRVDYFLTGPTCGAARPSEIRDARDGRLLRGGAKQAGIVPDNPLHSRHCTGMCRCREAQGCARAAIHGGQMQEVGQCMEQLPRTPEPDGGGQS